MAGFISATLAVCRNDSGELLMVQEGKEHVHGRWDFPGGGLEHDESVKGCVEREVQEETGYRVEAKGLYGTFIEESDTTDLPVIVFLVEAELKGEGEPDNHFDGEILDYGFFSISELREMELRKENRGRMLEIVEERGTVPISRTEDLREKVN
ncbi:MAG: NUDIX hydrolase [Candidatus Nanohaloarchaea archaeon]